MPLSLDNLALKVQTGAPLSDADVDALASSRDIIALGMLANALRQKLHGTEVTYVRVVDLKLADLKGADLIGADLKVGTTTGAANAGEANAGAANVVPTFRSAAARSPHAVPTFRSAAARSSHAGEIRIFQTPPTLDEAITAIERARELAGATPLSAFCLFELSKFSEGLPVVLPALKRAGLELITQAPVDRLPSAEQALEVLTDAGLRLARLTVNETPDRPWADVCRQVMTLQTALQSIRAFAPLARKIDSTQPTTGYEDVKRVAIARLVAHNVATIQVDWALYGPKLAQVALTFGADDIDSVSSENDESRGPRRSPVEEILRGVRAAGFEPVERDGRYERRG